MRNPFENLASHIPERLKYLAGSLGCSALSGAVYGVEASLLGNDTSFGIVSSVTALPFATISAAVGIAMYDRFLHPDEIQKYDETIPSP